VKKVVLAYSGGLDTSVAVAWLGRVRQVVTLTVDLAVFAARGVERRAMSAGATRAASIDARERFITDYVWPHSRQALYQAFTRWPPHSPGR
jgi:argininosuccinate synthase